MAMNGFSLNVCRRAYHYYPNHTHIFNGNGHTLQKWSKRFVELPPYHPKYKKPEMVFDLNLDWKRYRGFYRYFPIPPKARPAAFIFAAFIGLECFAFIGCHHMMMLAD
mmetsp:Transcript_18326/g.29038  ORF Transcript_18326/g.29038 Transcript_18326/m.29038 type:complete len:108 (+) Transcript_18326:694-1017(+)